MSVHGPMPRSAWFFPALAVLFFAAATALGVTFTPTAGGLVFAVVLLFILFGTVFAAVHHAEVIAERIGEPYGTLLLTLAVTIIEVALIATIMLGDKPVPTLARDTVFAVVMIVCNALVGICILAGGLRYREQDVQVTGSNLYLSVLIVLATITLILPNYTLTTPGPVYSATQLGFVSVVTVLLYCVFLYTQTVRHRDYFISEAAGVADNGSHTSTRALLVSGILLLVSLLAVVLLCRYPGSSIDPAARKRRRGLRCAQERPAEERQSGARFLDCDHWADDPGRRDCRLHAGQAIGAWAECSGYGAAGPDVRLEHAHLRNRPHQHPVWTGPSGGIRGICISGVRAVSSRATSSRECQVQNRRK